MIWLTLYIRMRSPDSLSTLRQSFYLDVTWNHSPLDFHFHTPTRSQPNHPRRLTTLPSLSRRHNLPLPGVFRSDGCGHCLRCGKIRLNSRWRWSIRSCKSPWNCFSSLSNWMCTEILFLKMLYRDTSPRHLKRRKHRKWRMTRLCLIIL